MLAGQAREYRLELAFAAVADEALGFDDLDGAAQVGRVGERQQGDARQQGETGKQTGRRLMMEASCRFR